MKKVLLIMAAILLARQLAAGQTQAIGLLAGVQLQYPVAQARQTLLGITAKRLKIQPQVAPGERGEILNQQALAARERLPVQAPFRVTGLVAAQPLVIIGTLAGCVLALVLLVE